MSEDRHHRLDPDATCVVDRAQLDLERTLRPRRGTGCVNVTSPALPTRRLGALSAEDADRVLADSKWHTGDEQNDDPVVLPTRVPMLGTLVGLLVLLGGVCVVGVVS